MLLFVALALLIFTSFIFGITALISGDERQLILAASLVPVVISAASVLMTRTRDLFSPLSIIFYMIFIGCFAKTLVLLFFDPDGIALQFSLANRPYEILYGGIQLLTIAMISMLAGYLLYLLATKTRSKSSYKVSDIKKLGLDQTALRIAGILILAISAVAFLRISSELNLVRAIAEGSISTKRIHESSIGEAPRGSALGYLRLFAQTIPQILFFMFLVAYYKQNQLFKWPDFILMILLGFMACLVPFLTSARLELVYLFLTALLIRHFAYKRITIFQAALVSITLLIGLGLLGQLREVRTGTESIQIGASLTETVLETLERPYFMDVGKTSVIRDTVPSDVNFIGGHSFMLVFYAPIPRTLWPEKPTIRIGPFVADEIYLREDDAGIPPGFIAELYMNFGILGVVFGMFLFGLIISWLYKNCIQNNPSPLNIVIYSIGTLVLCFTLITGDWTIFISQTLRFGIPLYLLALAVKCRAPLRLQV